MAMFKATAEVTIYLEKWVEADNIEDAKQIMDEEFSDNVIEYYTNDTIGATDDIEITGDDGDYVSWDVEYDEYIDSH